MGTMMGTSSCTTPACTARTPSTTSSTSTRLAGSTSPSSGSSLFGYKPLDKPTCHDCAFQRVCMHDDSREDPRHGLTIMQRRVDLSVDDCSTGGREKLSFD